MRKSAAFLILAAVVVLGCGMRAQSRVSPHERTPVVTVDGSEMFIEYGRPSTRGRTIFGSLVKYNEVWCPGADDATYLSTSKNLLIGGFTLPAGEYSLWILPTETDWQLIFNKEAHTFHTSYRQRSDVDRIQMTKQTLPQNVEQLTFEIVQTGPEGGRIAMSWATTKVSVPFLVRSR